MQEIDKPMSLYWVLAGSESEEGCDNIESSQVEIAKLGRYEYKTATGAILNIKDYKLFVVKGESMRFVGIHNHNLVFCTKKFNANSLEEGKPQILVIRKHSPQKDKPAYKLRRAWMIGHISDDLTAEIQNIIDSDDFQCIKALSIYDGNRKLLADFVNTRLPRYIESYIECENPDESDKTFVISTTFHTDTEEIRFSIHPMRDIVGNVVASFNLADKQIMGNVVNSV